MQLGFDCLPKEIYRNLDVYMDQEWYRLVMPGGVGEKAREDHLNLYGNQPQLYSES